MYVHARLLARVNGCARALFEGALLRNAVGYALARRRYRHSTPKYCALLRNRDAGVRAQKMQAFKPKYLSLVHAWMYSSCICLRQFNWYRGAPMSLGSCSNIRFDASARYLNDKLEC